MLFVCLLATLRKNFQTDLHEIFGEGWQWSKLNFGGDLDHRSGFVSQRWEDIPWRRYALSQCSYLCCAGDTGAVALESLHTGCNNPSHCSELLGQSTVGSHW